MYRLFSIGVFLMWVGAMAALFARDVWPALTAQDLPPLTRDRLTQFDQQYQQFGIFKTQGQRIGTAWRKVSTTESKTSIYGTIGLEKLPVVTSILVETGTEFDSEGRLDSFKLEVYGVPLTKIRVLGERRGIYFPCELQVGPLYRQVSLDVSASQLIGQSLQPFTFLPTLEVGQSWRMQLLDPFSAAIGGRTNFTPIIARVTGTETIEVQGRLVECFVVETSPHDSKAWVDPMGQVLVQQAQVPGLGKIEVKIEPFVKDLLHAAKQKRYTPGS